MKVTASQLRQNIYRILDEILRTGKAVDIERNGSILRIVPAKQSYSKLSKLKKRKLSNEDSENFAHIDWTEEWKGTE